MESSFSVVGWLVIGLYGAAVFLTVALARLGKVKDHIQLADIIAASWLTNLVIYYFGRIIEIDTTMFRSLVDLVAIALLSYLLQGGEIKERKLYKFAIGVFNVGLLYKLALLLTSYMEFKVLALDNRVVLIVVNRLFELLLFVLLIAIFIKRRSMDTRR